MQYLVRLIFIYCFIISWGNSFSQNVPSNNTNVEAILVGNNKAGTISNYVAFLSFPYLKLIKTLDAGIEPSWITNGFDGDTFFVSSRKSNEVYVFSYSQQKHWHKRNHQNVEVIL